MKQPKRMQALIATMRRVQRAGIVGCLLSLSNAAMAGLWFLPSGGADSIDSWDAPEQWYTWFDFKTKAANFRQQTDVNLVRPGTILVTNDVYSAGYWSVGLGGRQGNAQQPVVVRIQKGGRLKSNGGAMSVGANCQSFGVGAGVLDIRPSGTNEARLVVGEVGAGVVTNAGVYVFGGLDIGKVAGAMGLYVHDGGRNVFQYAKDMRIGIDGTGELQVRPGSNFNWYWWSSGSTRYGFVDVGAGSGGGHGRVVVGQDATFATGPLTLGGKDDTAGFGELRLLGGEVCNQATRASNGDVEQLWIGAGTNAAGVVRVDSVGRISGWGRIFGSDDAEDGIHVRIGNGGIVADGEGVERTLDCSSWASVSNVLATTDVTNGWNAVNKGAVMLPVVNAVLDSGVDNWNCFAGTNSVGCARQREVPDLLNAVHIKARRDWQAAGWNFGVLFLADDRSDIHAAALPSRYRPLGFWKAGTFGKRIGYAADVRPFRQAEIRFRYDARKIQEPDSALAVLRWDETSQAWRRLRRYSARPADGVVSSGELTQVSGDPDWTLGLFCVAELERQGLRIIIR